MSVCQFDKVTLADKVTLFATLLSVYQLDKVSFCTFIRQKSVTCSDNAPTVAPDKVPRNQGLWAGSFSSECPGSGAPCVSTGAEPWVLQLQRPPPMAETGSCSWGRGQRDASECDAAAGCRNPLLFAEKAASTQPAVSGNFIRCYCRSVI